MAVGYDISASISSSATSGNHTSLGPVTFAPVTVGTTAAEKRTSSIVWILGALGALALAFFLWRKK